MDARASLTCASRGKVIGAGPDMSDATSGSDFFAKLPVFSSFGRITDRNLYQPLPGDWTVGIADIVNSRKAMEAGRFKAVNMAGAAAISAVSNAVAGAPFPFVFGGDGASFAVPPELADAARAALSATATLVAEEFDLELRVAIVPVAAIREAGLDIRVARFAASPNVAYAMFSGGGIAWAEGRMKAGEFALAPAPPGSRPDLTGLSCRFDEKPAQRGLIASLIIRPATGAEPDRFEALVREILDTVERSPDMARPVPKDGWPLAWPSPGLELEARSGRRPGSALWLRRLLLLVRTAFSTFILRYHVRVGGFDPARYLDELVANTDYRKYDDGLRLTLDCSPDLADDLEGRLRRAEAAGIARFGLHRQEASLITCFTPSAQRSDHLHFIDGASGGYATASITLKG